MPVVLPGTPEAQESPESVRLPWWVEALNDQSPDWSILDHDWAHRPMSERPLLADGSRAGPYWDSLDVRMRSVGGEDDKLWLAAGMLSLDDPLTGSYSFFNETAVLQALDAGAIINSPCPIDRNMTALHYAARNGTKRCVCVRARARARPRIHGIDHESSETYHHIMTAIPLCALCAHARTHARRVWWS